MAELTDQEQLGIDIARRLLGSHGYVVLRAKSYRQAQERQRVAEALRRSEEQAAEHARAWARECLTEQRRLAERCTFLYGAAIAAGATRRDLSGDGGVIDELDRIDQNDEQEAGR